MKLKSISEYEYTPPPAPIQETLYDLRDDDEFVATAERFMASINKVTPEEIEAIKSLYFTENIPSDEIIKKEILKRKGNDVEDVFDYFRGADFNFVKLGNLASDVENWDEQTKKDYDYLRTRFDNASVGDIFGKERLNLTGDFLGNVLLDPVTWASTLLIPWTGGTSVVGRLATGEASRLAIKESVKQAIKEGSKLSTKDKLLNVTGQVLSKPLTTRQTLGILSAEGFTYASTFDYVNQSINIETNRIEERNLAQTLTSGALGAVIAPAIGGGIIGLSKLLPSKIKSLNNERVSKIDDTETPLSSYDKDIELAVYNSKTNTWEGIKLSADYLVGFLGQLTFTKPTSPLISKAKKNKELESLLRLLRFDSMEGFISPQLGKQQRLAPGYDELLRKLWATYSNKLAEIIKNNKLKSHVKARLPFTYNQAIDEVTNKQLVYYLRTGKGFEIVDGKKVFFDKKIVKAGKQIKKLLDDIFKDAEKAGLKVNKTKFYFPRGWKIDVIKKNKDEFIEKIMQSEKLSKDAATDLWKKIVTEGSAEGSTVARLNSRLTSERILTKLKDEDFSKFLDDNIEGVLNKYVAESANIISASKLLGSNWNEFVKKWINPINKVKGAKLSLAEEQYLKFVYGITTGQLGRKSAGDTFLGIPTGKIWNTFSDTMTITMQTSMLGFATLTSFAEHGVQLLLGKRGTGKATVDALADSIQEFYNKRKAQFGFGDPNQDLRSLSRQELNDLRVSMDVAMEDRAAAIYGEAVSNTGRKIQNFFFKSVLLYDWTRYAQLVAYHGGKTNIFRNLDRLANKTDLSEAGRLRLIDELNELDIDYKLGVEWIKNGAKHTDKFYEQIKAGAARYVNNVVMNPTAASNQKPILHSHWLTKWIYGLMGFHTAFSNTVLRNSFRNITRDARTFANGSGENVAFPRALGGALFLTSAGIFNEIVRTQGKVLEDLENNEITVEELLQTGARRSGLLGQYESIQNYERTKYWEGKISAAIFSTTGPNLPDFIEYVDDLASRGIVVETAFKRAPFSSVLKSQFPEIYDEWLEIAREVDKASPLAVGEKEEDVSPIPFDFDKYNFESEVDKDDRERKVTGGLVSGPKVPFTKENPADRINPFTKEPYQEQMDRLGFAEGTNANMINLIFLQKWHRKNFTDVDEFKGTLDKELKGKTVSMRLGTFGIDGKTYILPTYAKGIGKILPVETFIQDIKDGKIIGYKTVDEAEKQLKILRDKIINEERKGFAEGEEVVGEEVYDFTMYNNPGNIEEGQGFAGETGQFYAVERRNENKGAFVIFDTPEAGLRAVMRDIRSKIDDLDGDLLKMINRYAPPSDNNPTTNYYNFIKDRVGKEKVTYEDIPAITRAMVEFENRPTEEMTEQQRIAAQKRLDIYLNDDVFNRAISISQQEFDTGTTSEEMFNQINNN